MAVGRTAISFDEIIQADRQRRKNEALAKEIFGKNRKTDPTNNGSRKSSSNPTASLASRVGITKASQRLASNASKAKTSIEATSVHEHHLPNDNQTSRALRREHIKARGGRNSRLYQNITFNPYRNGTSHQTIPAQPGEEISIRGTAGPYLVIGSNFAPGTTAADIESAMIPNGGEMQSCKITSFFPMVVAEMTFIDKADAESVIATFNNKKADGRILNVYMKHGKPSVTSPAVQQPLNEPKPARVDLTTIDPVRNNLVHVEPVHNSSIRADPPRFDLRPEPAYNSQREQSDRSKRRADPELQDGSYGFDTKQDRMDVDAEDRHENWHNAQRETERARDGGRDQNFRRLYSDDIYHRPRERGYR